MTADPITLEYEVTAPEISAYSLRTPKLRRAWAVLCLVMASFAAVETRWWMLGLWLALAVEFWFRQQILVWLILKLGCLWKRSFHVTITTDDKGLLFDAHGQEKSSPIRYWWSRLADVREDEFGVMLLFDRKWNGLVIPKKAFEDSAQKTRFLDLTRQSMTG